MGARDRHAAHGRGGILLHRYVVHEKTAALDDIRCAAAPAGRVQPECNGAQNHGGVIRRVKPAAVAGNGIGFDDHVGKIGVAPVQQAGHKARARAVEVNAAAVRKARVL